MFGCGDNNDSAVWKKDLRSPDGSWVATAETDQMSGPGNA
jgi:hypothetical protein